MEVIRIILMIVAIIAGILFGYLLGRNSVKPKGVIAFETYFDEENNNEECVRCIFKLDMDVDDIVKEDYILFGVSKDKAVRDYYRKHTESK